MEDGTYMFLLIICGLGVGGGRRGGCVSKCKVQDMYVIIIIKERISMLTIDGGHSSSRDFRKPGSVVDTS